MGDDRDELDIQIPDEDYEQSPFVKYYKYTLGIILIVLMVSYFIFDPTVRDVIAGFTESSTVEDDRFIYGNKTIIFESETYQELADFFLSNQEHEFKACLQGNINGNVYLIDYVHHPRTHLQTVYRVVSEPCPDDTIISLHSHPYQKCIASETDIRTFSEEKKRNPDLLMAVMCTERRISFYG